MVRRVTPRRRPPKRGSSEAIGVTQLTPRPEFDSLFDALADADRLRLLDLLGSYSFPAGTLAKRLGWTRDATAKQLRLLQRAGLLRVRRIGRETDFVREAPALTAALGWLSSLWACQRVVRLQDAEVLDVDRWAALAGALRTAGRRDMLECMSRGGPITQGAAAEACGLSQGLASRGLARLMDVGMVVYASTALPRRYAAVPETMAAATRWLHSAARVGEVAQARFG